MMVMWGISTEASDSRFRQTDSTSNTEQLIKYLSSALPPVCNGEVVHVCFLRGIWAQACVAIPLSDRRHVNQTTFRQHAGDVNSA